MGDTHRPNADRSRTTGPADPRPPGRGPGTPAGADRTEAGPGLEPAGPAPTRWLDDSAADAWLNLVAVMELLPVTLDAQLLKDAGLTFVEFLTLTQLAEVPERTLRLTDLAATTNLGLPRISRIVARLERDGFLRREVNRKDGRSRQVRLTPAGWEKIAQASTGHIALVNRLFVNRLTPEQFDQLRVIGAQLVEGLDPKRRVLAQTFAACSGRPGLSRAPEIPPAP